MPVGLSVVLCVILDLWACVEHGERWHQQCSLQICLVRMDNEKKTKKFMEIKQIFIGLFSNFFAEQFFRYLFFIFFKYLYAESARLNASEKL